MSMFICYSLYPTACGHNRSTGSLVAAGFLHHRHNNCLLGSDRRIQASSSNNQLFSAVTLCACLAMKVWSELNFVSAT